MNIQIRYIGEYMECILDDVTKPDNGGTLNILLEKEDEDWQTSEGMKMLHEEIHRMLVSDPYRSLGRTIVSKNEQYYEFTINFVSKKGYIRELWRH